MIIDHKGSLRKGIQEMSKKGLKLYSIHFRKNSLISHTDLKNLSRILSDTIICPILCFNNGIWFMDDYLPS